jgi:hypothetical protein
LSFLPGSAGPELAPEEATGFGRRRSAGAGFVGVPAWRDDAAIVITRVSFLGAGATLAGGGVSARWASVLGAGVRDGVASASPSGHHRRAEFKSGSAAAAE